MELETLDAFWKTKIDSIPREVIEQWLKDRFPGLEGLQYIVDGDVYVWVYQTLCGQLFLYGCPPDSWLILKVWEYLEKPEKQLRDPYCSRCGAELFSEDKDICSTCVGELERTRSSGKAERAKLRAMQLGY